MPDFKKRMEADVQSGEGETMGFQKILDKAQTRFLALEFWGFLILHYKSLFTKASLNMVQFFFSNQLKGPDCEEKNDVGQREQQPEARPPTIVAGDNSSQCSGADT